MCRIRVSAPSRIGIAGGLIGREFHPFAFEFGGCPMRGIDPKHDRGLALIGGFQFGKKGCVGSSVDHLKRQIKGCDAFLIKAAPCDRPAQIAALRRGFGGAESLGTGGILQGFPIRQAGAFFLHVKRIPPFFLGLHASGTQHLDVARRGGGVHRITPRGFPDFHGHMQIAGFQPGELGQIIGLNIFDVVATLFQHLAHQLGGDQLARPVVQRQLDRIGGLLCHRG